MDITKSDIGLVKFLCGYYSIALRLCRVEERWIV
jgi:hypothetical protein